MSTYLSRIAGRNNPDNAPLLMPALSLISKSDPDPDLYPFQPPISHPTGINSLKQDNFLPKQTNEPRQNLPGPVVQKEVKKIIESPLPGKTFDSRYITRHIGRLVFSKNKEQEEYISTKNPFANFTDPPANTAAVNSQHTKNIETPIQSSMEPLPKKSAEEQKNTLTNIESQYPQQRTISTGKNPITRPSVKKVHPKNTNPVINKPAITRLTPAQPTAVPIINTKNNKSTPKLVIGKITVEVVQPDKPAVSRVVNRIITAPSVPDGSKRNKLSFGLGQL